MRINIHIATLRDLEGLLFLFNKYRDFYEQKRDEKTARKFLVENLKEKKSVIFVATDDESKQSLGFAQLNPGRCSLALDKYWIFYDLFVDENYRKKGVAQALMDYAEKFAIDDGASRIELQTAKTNVKAQKLYEKNGYQQEKDFFTYAKVLSKKTLDKDKQTTQKNWIGSGMIALVALGFLYAGWRIITSSTPSEDPTSNMRLRR